MPEIPQNSIQDLVTQTRARLDQELQAQAAQLQKLEENLQELRSKQKQVESAIREQLEALGKAQPAPAAADASLEKVLGAVRNLITATFPEQVQDVLTEEAEQLGVRAAVFEVRGKAAWGASARGFSSGLLEKTFRALVVPLTQNNPFRHCFETAGSVDTDREHLAKNRNVLDKLQPESGDLIVLLPIRSAGSVSAIFYADTGGKKELPVDALKILAEFAGAQLDRLMALSGGLPSQAAEAEPDTAVEEVAEVEAEESVEIVEPEPAAEEVAATAAAAEPSASTAVEAAPAAEAPPAPAAVDVSQLSEADQKVHRDAKRFARLLVSEIELYNKAKVADGRKNKDLYTRLKSDIERSRQTYAKRFGKTVAKQQDYFHEELVRTLAANDPSVLGSDYPGPSA